MNADKVGRDRLARRSEVGPDLRAGRVLPSGSTHHRGEVFSFFEFSNLSLFGLWRFGIWHFGEESSATNQPVLVPRV